MGKSSAKRRFTEQMLRRLSPPRSGRIELADELCPGLVLRVTELGTKSFSAIYHVAGEGGVSDAGRVLVGVQHRMTLGRYPVVDLAKAREKTREILLAASEGRDPRDARVANAVARRTNSVEAVVARFIEQEAKPNIKSWPNLERVLRIHVLPAWGARPISEIRRSHAHELLDELMLDGTTGAAREVRKHLSRLFSWALDRDLVRDNPVQGLRRKELQANPDRGRALKDDELRAIWAAATEMGYPFGDLYKLLILTGQRLREWGNATWSEVNTTAGLLEVPRARFKGRRDHLVPLSETALHCAEPPGVGERSGTPVQHPRRAGAGVRLRWCEAPT
jgi:hypothetical protein